MNSLGTSILLCTAVITPVHGGLGQQIFNKIFHASLMNSPIATKNATRMHETFSMLMQKTGSKMQFRGALKY